MAIAIDHASEGVRFDTLEKICEALDCQPGDILEYRPEEQEERTVAPLTQRTRRKAWRRLLQEHIDIDIDTSVIALEIAEIFLDDEVFGVETLLIEIGGNGFISRLDFVIGAAMLEFQRLA
jgi:hypothetical protein